MQGAVLGKRYSKVVEHGIEILSVFSQSVDFWRVFFFFFFALRLTHKIGYLKYRKNEKRKKRNYNINATIFSQQFKIPEELDAAEGFAPESKPRRVMMVSD